MHDTMLGEGTIGAHDVDFLHPVETVDEAIRLIRGSMAGGYNAS
jgi:hypothetical protein